MLTTETRITATIDWISVTGERMTHPAWMSAEHVERARGMLNYDTGIDYLDGRVELWHSSRPEMGTHLIMSGDALTNMCSVYGKTVFDILDAYSFARTARIDVCVDVIGGTLDMALMADMIHNDQVRSRAKSGMYLENVGEGAGETLYLGSPKGERRLRVYDKAAESGIEGSWTRVELQSRGKQAQKATISLMSKGTGERTKSISELILNFADWEKYPDWKIALGFESAELTRMPKPPSARRKWILDTVAKAIAKEIEFGTGQSIIGELLDMVAIERDILAEKVKRN